MYLLIIKHIVKRKRNKSFIYTELNILMIFVTKATQLQNY